METGKKNETAFFTDVRFLGNLIHYFLIVTPLVSGGGGVRLGLTGRSLNPVTNGNTGVGGCGRWSTEDVFLLFLLNTIESHSQ